MTVGSATSGFMGLLGVNRAQPTPLSVRPAAAEPSDGTARSEFLKFAHMSPAERIREDLLKKKGITEDELKALPKGEQDAIEKEIVETIKREVIAKAEETKKAGLLADIRA